MCRIVETDNFGGRFPNEQFVLFPMPKANAEAVAEAINRAASAILGGSCMAPRYWKVVEKDYVLKPGLKSNEGV